MNWKNFWEQKGTHANLAVQVGRIRKGKALEDEMLNSIANRIVDQAQIQMHHNVLDMCCGNGQLSRLIKNHCSSLTGVDFSESLINQARRLPITNVEWKVGDAATYQTGQQFDRIILYFSFQYFERRYQAEQVIDNLCSQLKPGGILLLGDIPDSRKWFNFYKSPYSWVRLIKQKLTGTNTMGRFWNPHELAEILQKRGLRVEIEGQENWQPFSDYRFDLLAYS